MPLILTDNTSITLPGRYLLLGLTTGQAKEVVGVYDSSELVSCFTSQDLWHKVLTELEVDVTGLTIADTHTHSKSDVCLVVSDSGYQQLSYYL